MSLHIDIIYQCKWKGIGIIKNKDTIIVRKKSNMCFFSFCVNCLCIGNEYELCENDNLFYNVSVEFVDEDNKSKLSYAKKRTFVASTNYVRLKFIINENITIKKHFVLSNNTLVNMGKVHNSILSDSDIFFMNINTIFDEIYVLGLERKLKKMEDSVKKLNDIGITAKKNYGIDGENKMIKKKYDDLKWPKPQNEYAYGCLLSHLQIIEDAKLKKFKTIMVVEDDIFLNKKHEMFGNRLAQIPEDWVLLYLGASQDFKTWNNITHHHGYYNAYKTDGTFAYCLRESIFDEVLELLKSYSGNIDTLLHVIQERHKSYVMFPNMIIADVKESSIRNPKNEKVNALEKVWQLENYIISD
jgi:GR25 family glycosyltransferase involved in LPS biosynthesis